jgi:FKBP-type peptidyl-prolyl cis-trans isomerase (trigger factor)
MRDNARERVRRSLVLGEFTRLEDLDTTSAEVDAEIERLASEAGEKAEQLRAVLSEPEQRQFIENRLLSRKIGDRLLAIATSATTGEAPQENESIVEEPEPPVADEASATA